MERINHVDVEQSENAAPIADTVAKHQNFFMETLKAFNCQLESNIHQLKKSEESKIPTEQMDALRNEVRELTETNLKMSNQVFISSEQIKTQQKNVATYKRQINTLEERNLMHETTIYKHEISFKYLKIEASNTMTKLLAAENRNKMLQHKCDGLMDINRSLEVELQLLNRREKKSLDSILQSDLKKVKESIERIESGDYLRMEQRLDEARRECLALDRRLQEEQDHFRKEINAIKVQKENAEKKISDEQSLAEILKTKLIKAEVEIKAKNQEIIELNGKLSQSLVHSLLDHANDDANSEFNELKQQLEKKIVEIDNLKKQISATAGKEAGLIQMSSFWEEEARALKENLELTKSKLTNEIDDVHRIEEAVVERLELQQKLECLDQPRTVLQDHSNARHNIEASSVPLLTMLQFLRNETKDSDLVDVNNENIEDFKLQTAHETCEKESGCQSDSNNLKQTNVRLPQEITVMKSTIKKKEDDCAEVEKAQSKKIDDLSSQLSSCQDEMDKLRKKNETLNKQDENKVLDEATSQTYPLTEANLWCFEIWKSQWQAEIKKFVDQQSTKEDENKVLEEATSQIYPLTRANLRCFEIWKSIWQAEIKKFVDQDSTKQESIGLELYMQPAECDESSMNLFCQRV